MIPIITKMNQIHHQNLIMKIEKFINVDGDYEVQIAERNLVLRLTPLRYKIITKSIKKWNYQNKFPIIFPTTDYLCNGASWNNESFSTINKSLAKYFCNRRSSNSHNVPFLVLLIHQYQKDGLVYQLHGSSNILLSDLGKISNIKIDYLK